MAGFSVDNVCSTIRLKGYGNWPSNICTSFNSSAALAKGIYLFHDPNEVTADIYPKSSIFDIIRARAANGLTLAPDSSQIIVPFEYDQNGNFVTAALLRGETLYQGVDSSGYYDFKPSSDLEFDLICLVTQEKGPNAILQVEKILPEMDYELDATVNPGSTPTTPFMNVWLPEPLYNADLAKL